MKELVPLTWLANELSRTGIGMKAGTDGQHGDADRHAAAEARRDVADFGPFGSVAATYT
jgi:2-keto-4-pentenoate hydratase